MKSTKKTIKAWAVINDKGGFFWATDTEPNRFDVYASLGGKVAQRKDISFVKCTITYSLPPHKQAP